MRLLGWAVVAAVVIVAFGGFKGDEEPEATAVEAKECELLDKVLLRCEDEGEAVDPTGLSHTVVLVFDGTWQMIGSPVPAAHSERDSEVVSVGSNGFSVAVLDAEGDVLYEQSHSRGDVAELNVFVLAGDHRVVVTDDATGTHPFSVVADV